MIRLLGLLVALMLVIVGCGGSDTYSPTGAGPAVPSFTANLSPASQTVAPGAAATYTLVLRSVNSFSQAVDLSALGLPPGATAVFSQTSVVPTDSGVNVQVTVTSPTTTSFRVVSSGGGRTVESPASLTVADATVADSALEVTPGTVEIDPNGVAVFQVTVTALGGYDSEVVLSSSTATANVSRVFGLNPIFPTSQGRTTTLTVSPFELDKLLSGRADDPDTTITIVVTATGPGVAPKTRTVTVRVVSPVA